MGDLRKMIGMSAICPIAIATLAAIALIGSHGFGAAQTSMGGSEPSAPLAPTPPPPPSPRLDYIPPSLAPTTPGSNQPTTTTDQWWGAIGFTADGSYSSSWKMPSKGEAEAKVAKQCASFGRGGCEVVSVSGQDGVA